MVWRLRAAPAFPRLLSFLRAWFNTRSRIVRAPVDKYYWAKVWLSDNPCRL